MRDGTIQGMVAAVQDNLFGKMNHLANVMAKEVGEVAASVEAIRKLVIADHLRLEALIRVLDGTLPKPMLGQRLFNAGLVEAEFNKMFEAYQEESKRRFEEAKKRAEQQQADAVEKAKTEAAPKGVQVILPEAGGENAKDGSKKKIELAEAKV